MSKPKRVSSYPRQLIELVLKFEEGGGAEYVVYGLGAGVAHQVRSELYGLRKAMEKAGESSSYPFFMSARMYLRDDALVIVGADELPYAKLLGTNLGGG